MKHYSGYTVSEMKECIMRLLDTLNRPRKYSAVYNKYKAKKFQSASIYFEEWIRLNGGDSTYNVEWEKL